MDFKNYLRSLQNNQSRGSERTHYPALKSLLDLPAEGLDAAIEEKGNKAGIPDFTVRRRELLVGYVEAKDIGIDLDATEKTEQLKRYRESFPNLILTNYLEFRWYVEGRCRLKVILGNYSTNNGIEVADTRKTAELIEGFLNYTGEIISSPETLAEQMARLTKAIKYAVEEALKRETETGELHQLKRGFKEVLLPDLDDTAFADMYAQTVSYGLFAARVGHAQNPGNYPFERRTAGTYIPATNPFLKRLFNTIVETDAISQINWAIDDLVQLLAQVDMSNILEDFGKRSRQEDPVVHFYETFLAAYDAALRKSRGVYYTPEPVVSFIVRSVDLILKNRFNLPLGLADNSQDKVTQQPRVQILDPATGTGTFLYSVVNQIYQNLEEMGLASTWNDYVQTNLLSRLYGFELLMAPYSIAHLKLGLQLQELGYKFTGKQRLGIYLTNTLDEALKKSEVLFGQFVAQEANDASAIKQDVPVMVVLGNPPYSISSSNRGNFIEGLMQRYKKAVRSERNIQPLSDDYIKFIRFAHHQIEQTGYGIVGFITNHSYINGLIHRGMREELLKSFDQIYVMDLHGNSLLKETCPDGSPDQNVFDIKQGVAILIAVKDLVEKEESKQKAETEVFYYDLWGRRKDKYDVLNSIDVQSVDWETLQPTQPNYFFSPKDFNLSREYQKGWSVSNIFSVNSSGIKTHRDDFVIDFDMNILDERLHNFADSSVSDSIIKTKYNLKESQAWKIKSARKLVSIINISSLIKPILYRPFDDRYIFYSESCCERLRCEVMNNLNLSNLALIVCRQQKNIGFRHCFISKNVGDGNAISINSREYNYYFPLYIYPDTENAQGNLLTDRTPNFSSNFLSAIREKLGYIPTPEAIFYYAYAIFHSPTYRQGYAEFLKIDFPRLPLTSNNELFKALAQKGEELVKLHLMESKRLNKLITKYQGEGENEVTQVKYKPKEQQVYINKQRYFEGIPLQVWEFKIGGYQVLDKWLKDRKKAKRSLSFDDILHYQRIVVALKETMQIMIEIDALIPGFPIE